MIITQKHNNRRIPLDSSVGIWSSVLTLPSGYGALFDDATPYRVNLVEYNDDGEFTAREIVTIQKSSGDTFAITARAVEPCPYTSNDTTDSQVQGAFTAWSSYLELTLTNEEIELLQTTIENKANDNEVVHLTGDETVAGVKTFSSIPKVPLEPVDNDNVTSKKYVDDEIAAASAIDKLTKQHTLGEDMTEGTAYFRGTGGETITDWQSQNIWDTSTEETITLATSPSYDYVSSVTLTKTETGNGNDVVMIKGIAGTDRRLSSADWTGHSNNGYTITASNEVIGESYGWEAWRVLDGVDGGDDLFWYSGEGTTPPQYIEITFPKKHTLSKISVTARTNANLDNVRSITDCYLEWLVDGVWSTIETRSWLSFSSGETKELTFTETENVEAIRYTVTAVAAWSADGVVISEFDFFWHDSDSRTTITNGQQTIQINDTITDLTLTTDVIDAIDYSTITIDSLEYGFDANKIRKSDSNIQQKSYCNGILTEDWLKDEVKIGQEAGYYQTTWLNDGACFVSPSGFTNVNTGVFAGYVIRNSLAIKLYHPSIADIALYDYVAWTGYTLFQNTWLIDVQYNWWAKYKLREFTFTPSFTGSVRFSVWLGLDDDSIISSNIFFDSHITVNGVIEQTNVFYFNDVSNTIQPWDWVTHTINYDFDCVPWTTYTIEFWGNMDIDNSTDAWVHYVRLECERIQKIWQVAITESIL